jgi:hypothetical protein
VLPTRFICICFRINLSSVGMADLEKALARVNRKLTEKVFVMI